MPPTVPVEFPLISDLIFIRSAISQLEDYLISQQPTWQLDIASFGGKTVYPLLSPGTLLLACARICPKRYPDQFSAERQELLLHRQQICQKWMSAWRKKILQDFQSYAFLWRSLLEDYRFDRDQAAYYPFEIHQRVVLDLLVQESPEILNNEKTILENSDVLLQEIFPSGDFIWETSLSVCFPPNPYWYLYRKI